MCGSTKGTNKTKDDFQIRDDFKSASENYTISFLKSKNAIDDDKSVLILTQGFKGEKIIVKQNSKSIYSEYALTNLKRQYAASFAFSNKSPISILNNNSKQEVTIEPKHSDKHKYIYVMRESDGSFKITLSNTLRNLN